jgi:hypothetical protein
LRLDPYLGYGDPVSNPLRQFVLQRCNMNDANSSSIDPPDFPAEYFRSTAAAFSQVAGVLGGFCITVLVLVLPPEFLKENPSTKDWVIGLLLLAVFSYIASASILANSMNAPLPWMKTLEARINAFSWGISLFHSGNLLLAVVLLLLVYSVSRTVGFIAIVIVLALTVIVILRNIGFTWVRRRAS